MLDSMNQWFKGWLFRQFVKVEQISFEKYFAYAYTAVIQFIRTPLKQSICLKLGIDKTRLLDEELYH